MREKRSTEDRMRKCNICLIGISEEQTEEGEATILTFRNCKFSPQMMKEINPNIQE